MTQDEFKKLKLSFRYWLLGKADGDPRYYRVLKAMKIAEKYHNGKRKDNSPEFSHQIQICMYIKTIHRYLRDPTTTFIVALFHDTLEDYFAASNKEIFEMFPEEYDYIMRISKVRNGNKIAYEQYFGEMKECDICSIVKLVDRFANISTMIGVFKPEKQLEYLEEVNIWFLPMQKYSREKFPDLELAYENIKTLLVIQRDTILAVRAEFTS